MQSLRGGNRWKMAGVLFVLAAFLGVMLLVPALRPAPVTTPEMDVPAMSNVPSLGGPNGSP